MTHRSRRFLSSSLIATMLVTVALMTAPAAYAGKPDRDVLGPRNPSVIPAGEGCSFDVLLEPSSDARRMVFEFDDGRSVLITNGNPTITNLATSATFSHRARYHITDTYNPAANEWREVITGQILVSFFPGDPGPYGEVAAPGRLLRFTGTVRMTFDGDTFAMTSFWSEGLIADICAALS